LKDIVSLVETIKGFQILTHYSSLGNIATRDKLGDFSLRNPISY